jgi:membrane-associated phospholipid phosphatase
MKPMRHARWPLPARSLLPVVPFWLWAAFWGLRHELRWEHVAMAMALSTCAYATDWTRALFVGLVPLALTAILYDAMKLVRDLGVTAANVHACDVRDAELSWFGITSNGTRMTLQDWFLIHRSSVADLLCAIPYGTFLLFTLAYAIFLFFRDRLAELRFVWSFFTVNLMGYVTYHLFPAAPPWYLHAHGCTIDLATAPHEGPHLANVDEMLHLSFFARMYARSSDVFGAVPSLHAAYPMLMVLVGFPLHRWPVRLALAGFYLWTCFSAVYLDHHWVIDVLLGSVYAVLATLIVRRFVKPPPPQPPANGVRNFVAAPESHA